LCFAAELRAKYVRKMMGFVNDSNPRLQHSAMQPQLLAFLEQVLGEKPRLFQVG